MVCHVGKRETYASQLMRYFLMRLDRETWLLFGFFTRESCRSGMLLQHSFCNCRICPQIRFSCWEAKIIPTITPTVFYPCFRMNLSKQIESYMLAHRWRQSYLYSWLHVSRIIEERHHAHNSMWVPGKVSVLVRIQLDANRNLLNNSRKKVLEFQDSLLFRSLWIPIRVDNRFVLKPMTRAYHSAV